MKKTQISVNIKERIFKTTRWDHENQCEVEIVVSLFDCLKHDIGGIRVHEIAEELINQIREQLNVSPINIVKP